MIRIFSGSFWVNATLVHKDRPLVHCTCCRVVAGRTRRHVRGHEHDARSASVKRATVKQAKVAPWRRAPPLRTPEWSARRHRSTDGERARHRPREEKGGQRRSGIVIEVNGQLPDVTRVSASSGGREKQHPVGARRQG
ncbi:hypothetical protein PVAP13_2NG582120 [Panicum virgatum]|uniref:Uncharacterized protein n=1 Tax=Panicum virgatum TaxID=38727 RepID=A0A8T0VUY0_PANVG|nr:hypothetical protein PVAP13_2NG582120 [Panicum virgatum]